MKKLFFILISSFAFGQTPNYFFSNIGTISSTDTTCTIAATDTSYLNAVPNCYATIWDTYYLTPERAYMNAAAEIVLIETRSARVLQIIRAQLSSTARNFNVSGRVYRITVEKLASQ